MSRLLLTAAILLLLAAATAASSNTNVKKEVECEGSSYEVDTTDVVTVSLSFESIAPVFVSDSPESRGNLLYMPAGSARWDGPLRFVVVLDHYAPRQKWVIGVYTCTLKINGTAVDTRTFEVLEGMPQMIRTVITLTVPATAASYSTSNSTKVSKPLRGTYCEELPDADSWPHCPQITPSDNTVSVYPPSWRALEVNGRRAGETVKGYGVNATIPNPWGYGVESNVGTFSYVLVDGRRYGPRVYDAPVDSYVELHMVGMPTHWGSVRLRQTPNIPVYVARWVRSSVPPTAFCRPPSCVILTWHNTSCFLHGDRVPAYDALVAVQSGNVLRSLTAFPKVWHSEIRLPLGSVYLATIYTEWSVPFPIFDESFSIYLRERFGGGSMYLRVIRGNTYYEGVAGRGKVNGPLSSSGPRFWENTATVAVAVDPSVQSIELGVYTWPMPMYYTAFSTTIYRHAWGEPCPGPVLTASVWLTDALMANHPDISGGRYVDLLHYLYGEPVVYYWGRGDQHGAVSVHTERRYEQTTADAAGQGKLYYVKGIAPTDVAVLDMSWSMPQTLDKKDRVSPWLVWLVPTAACRSMFCPLLSPELVGPLPPFPSDRALPDTGYSIMLTYIGPTGRHRVKVYVEDGYVISSEPSLTVSRVQNYMLIEIDKEWKPFETVVVGPGWWVPYRRLGPCETMPVRVLSIYATPDRLGPVKIIVEDNGVNFIYVFYVSNNVGYRITTRTPAPESITATPFNMTAYVTLDGVPYYHAVYGYGEGGRLSPPACLPTRFYHYSATQLVFSGDFWDTLGLTNTPMKPVNIQYIYTKPRLELADPWRGLVRVRADGPVSGFAFYAQRGGTWVKIGETRGSCLLINASRLFPWDPILVLPLVEQELDAAPGSTVTVWRPETALLFKTWADVVGYPKGARSELRVVRRC
jgi:hypothetical protein